MRAIPTSPAQPRAELLRAIPRGWYWLAALGISLALWWAIVQTVGALITLVFG